MSQADLQYKRVIDTVLRVGVWDTDSNVRTKWADGSSAYTKSWIGQKMIFDNSEVPILTSKFVAWRWAILELLWIWQKKSNVVQDLRDMGVNIWDEWEFPDGTIGKAYGYQLGKKNRTIETFPITITHGNSKDGVLYGLTKKRVDQVDYLLHELKNNPTSRRHITNIWNPDELDEMALTPCVYETQWYVKGGELHLEVRCRSNDLALGNPFNVFQYNVLQRMVAQVLGLKLGNYVFNIGDAHIYDRHIENIVKQVDGNTYEAPTLWINPDIKNFYDFTIDDFKLIDYKHGGRIDYEVAI